MQSSVGLDQRGEPYEILASVLKNPLFYRK